MYVNEAYIVTCIVNRCKTDRDKDKQAWGKLEMLKVLFGDAKIYRLIEQGYDLETHVIVKL